MVLEAAGPVGKTLGSTDLMGEGQDRGCAKDSNPLQCLIR